MKRVVVVDAYSSGNLLAPELIGRGCEVIHIRSQPVIPPAFVTSFRATNFIADIAFTGDLLALCDEIEEWAPIAVLVGAESGVRLAELISNCLGLRGNSLKHSAARRDKRQMVDTVQKAGLAAGRQSLNGTGFRVDTVSLHGKHLVTAIWECGLTESILLRQTHSPQYAAIVEFFFKALNALGIQEGPAFGKIVLTDDGPVLVELSASAAGASAPTLVKECGGYDQITAMVDCVLNPERFHEELAAPRTLAQKRQTAKPPAEVGDAQSDAAG